MASEAFALKMFKWAYLNRQSWSEGKFLPSDELVLPVVNYTNQYAFGCFEGMKAYTTKDGKISIFRPEMNAARFAKSMEGLYMEPFPPEKYLAATIELAKRNRDEFPAYDEDYSEAVYYRPYTCGEEGIGVNIPKDPYVVFVLTKVGAYYKGGLQALRVVVSDRIRATGGGTGALKCDANYVISALASEEARRAGFDEAMFLDWKHRKFVDEGAAANAFFLLNGDVLVTPPLTDLILPGITRDSIITLARDEGLDVQERPVSVYETMYNTKEAFFCGTAAVVTPVATITYENEEHTIGTGDVGEFTRHIYDRLTRIQHGDEEDKFGWNTTID